MSNCSLQSKPQNIRFHCQVSSQIRSKSKMFRFRREHPRPFAANDSKRISNDSEMLYPGLLDGRRHGSDGSTDDHEPLRTIVDGLFQEQIHDDPISGQHRPMREAVDSPRPSRALSNLENKTSRISQRNTAHIEPQRTDARLRTRPHTAVQRQRPRLTRNTSSSERGAKWDRSQTSVSNHSKPSYDRQSRSHHNHPTRLLHNLNPEPMVNREEELAEYQRLNDEMMRDLDEWFNSQPSVGYTLPMRSFNEGVVY